MQHRLLKILILFVLLVIIGGVAGYTAWNTANPEKTCASCHEITPSLEIWQISTHREINCQECHGTAFSNGLHSIREKAGMVFAHAGQQPVQSELHLTEAQVIETMERCVNCHQDEYKKWQSGGHSATYANIFLNEAHNSNERLYWDCFRCHGMYYEGTIYDLVDPVSIHGPWQLRDENKADDPTITCLACHEIHTENMNRRMPASMDDPSAIFYERKQASRERHPKAGLYVRADQLYLRADHLPKPAIYEGEREVNVSANVLQSICVQCHAPGWEHQAGTEDDRTPSGVHEGLACMACHETHSNDASNACMQCHPAISNCGLDHMTMNTTYHSPDSPNNIHHVKCIDCHTDEIPARMQ